MKVPAASVPPLAAAWSGVWSGWADQGRKCDIRLIVEAITRRDATIVCVRASAQRGLFSERVSAQVENDELHARLACGGDVRFRMRNSDVVELVWREATGSWMAGVLSRSVDLTLRQTQRIPTEWVERGELVSLEAVIFRPAGAGPFPAVMFNHGSTGNGDDASLFASTWTSPALAKFFTDRGWMAVFPQRRGRGKSGGVYDEGLEPDRSRYSDRAEFSLPGVERALSDLDVATAWLAAHPDVDRNRMLIGGHSRGGILAIAYVGTRSSPYCGAINFVGGWVDEHASEPAINEATFKRGAACPNPSLWLYADNDPFYGLAHSRKNFDAFLAAGGKGAFHVVPTAFGEDGHHIAARPDLWAQTLDDYIAQVAMK